jgi:hypothetical protein
VTPAGFSPFWTSATTTSVRVLQASYCLHNTHPNLSLNDICNRYVQVSEDEYEIDNAIFDDLQPFSLHGTLLSRPARWGVDEPDEV